MNVRGLAAFLFFILLCGVFVGAFAAVDVNRAEGQSFIVREILGRAQYREVDGAWKEVTEGMTLLPGMRVRTSDDSFVDMSFGDDRASSVTLRSGTMDIRGAEDGRGLSIMLHTGRVSANVRPPHAASFFIQTKNAVIRVQGTEFGVEFDEGAGAVSGIFVFHGEVLVQGIDPGGEERGAPRTLGAGERVIANAQGNILPTTPVRRQDENRFGIRVNTEPLQLIAADEEVADAKEEGRRKRREREPCPGREYAPTTAKGGFGFSLGAENIDGTNHIVFILTPRIQIGRFGIGFYLPAYMNLQNGLSEFYKPVNWYNSDDYKFSNFESVLLMFQYIQWGQKNDPVYIKLGSIDDFMLGNGFLVNNFGNMLEFPRNRRIGAQFDVRFCAWGFETMMADIYETEIFGGRLFFTPFLGFFNDFEFGFSYVTDVKPEPSGDDSARVYAFGFDISQPLPSLGILTWKAFADVAFQGYDSDIDGADDSRYGLSAGVKGRILFFDYLLAYRRLQGGFIAEYFDSFYYAEREARAQDLITGKYGDYNGLVFMTGFEFSKVFSIRLQYQNYYGSDSPPNKLGLYAMLHRGIIPKIFASFQYERIDFPFKKVFSGMFGDDVVTTARIFYEMNRVVDLVFTFRRFYEDGGDYKSTYGVETQFRF
jgi:hypothetical protein